MVQAKSRNRKKQNAATQASRLPDPLDIVAAVESLYADELRPDNRILRKRLLELHSVRHPHVACDLDMQKLFDLCSGISVLQVLPDRHDEWWVEFAGRESTFIDIANKEDAYPEELWHAFQAYFETNAELDLPGGRYECARALLHRNLPCLAGYSLGRICQIVQVAISTKKILGYNAGAIVPYRSSQSMAKEQCAASNMACSANGGSAASLPALSWEQAKFYLAELLRFSSPEGIPLPNVKRLVKSTFNVQLSETALGYSKVSDLLRDPRLQDICLVKKQGHGYVLTQAPAKIINLASLLTSMDSATASPGHDQLNVEEPMSFNDAELENEPMILIPTPSSTPCCRTTWTAEVPGRQRFDTDEPFAFNDAEFESEPVVLIRTPPSSRYRRPTWKLSPATLAKDGYARIKQNTFIHVKLPPESPVARSARRFRSEPKDMGLHEEWTEFCEQSNVDINSRRSSEFHYEVHSHSDDSTSEGSSNSCDPPSSTGSSREESPHRDSCERVQFCPDEPLFIDDGTTMGTSIASPVPMPRSRTPGILCTPSQSRVHKKSRTVRFVMDEHLESGEDASDERACKSALASIWSTRTCEERGIVEQNTFLHVALPPTTPAGLAAHYQAKSCGELCV